MNIKNDFLKKVEKNIQEKENNEIKIIILEEHNNPQYDTKNNNAIKEYETLSKHKL